MSYVIVKSSLLEGCKFSIYIQREWDINYKSFPIKSSEYEKKIYFHVLNNWENSLKQKAMFEHAKGNAWENVENHGNTDIDLLQKYIYHCGGASCKREK